MPPFTHHRHERLVFRCGAGSRRASALRVIPRRTRPMPRRPIGALRERQPRAVDRRAGPGGGAGPDLRRDPHDVEARRAVGVPDLAPRRHDRGLGHGEVAGHELVLGSRLRGRDVVGDLLRVQEVADVEHAQPGGDERARHDRRVDLAREAAVVGRVALDGAGGAGVAARRRVVGRLVDLEAEVGDDARRPLVGDVDDAAGADGVLVAGSGRALGVLVELEHVGLAVAGEGDRVLRDRGRLPGQPAHLARLRLGLAAPGSR